MFLSVTTHFSFLSVAVDVCVLTVVHDDDDDDDDDDDVDDDDTDDAKKEEVCLCLGLSLLRKWANGSVSASIYRARKSNCHIHK